jgi:hypothetical protein
MLVLHSQKHHNGPMGETSGRHKFTLSATVTTYIIQQGQKAANCVLEWHIQITF